MESVEEVVEEVVDEVEVVVLVLGVAEAAGPRRPSSGTAQTSGLQAGRKICTSSRSPSGCPLD